MKVSATLKLLIAMLPVGCGAPTKPASSVASLFLSTDSLQDILSHACDNLTARIEAPTTKGLKLNLQGCQRAGQAALNYAEADAFAFVNIDGSIVGTSSSANLNLGRDLLLAPETEGSASSAAPTTEPPVSSRKTRAQIWLNKSLLDVAETLTNFMKDKQNFGRGVVELPDSASKNFASLAKTSINIVKKPELDMSELYFSTQIEINISGIVKASQVLQVDGKLLDNSVAIVIRTLKPAAYSESIIRNIEFVLFVTPYANDVYIDLYSNVDFYNIGLQSVLDKQLNSFLSTGLKSVLDSLMIVRGNS
jgi:hypothetical protein